MLATLAAAAFLPARALNVFAAASLKEAFTAIARTYQESHPGTVIRLNFGGSQMLAAQIRNGAPADVFASAAEKNLDQVSYVGESKRTFALNRLVIATRPRFSLASPQELIRARAIAVADPSVPVGSYTEAFFSKAAAAYGTRWLDSVRSNIVSRELDVKAVLAKVRLGEADAGIVYSSDIATAGGRVGRTVIPERLNLVATYPVATLSYGENADDAKAFVKFLFTPKSQHLLELSGFVSPLRPVVRIAVEGSSPSSLRLPLTQHKVTVSALDDRKHSHAYTGVPVSSLPIFRTGTKATFIGADGYAQTVAIAALRTSKAVLVRQPDGNYQLVVPGMSPGVWVNWLRQIRIE